METIVLVWLIILSALWVLHAILDNMEHKKFGAK